MATDKPEGQTPAHATATAALKEARKQLAESEELRRQFIEGFGADVAKLRTSEAGLLDLLYRIRVAAGDKAGRLMQAELVEHIAALAKDREELGRARELADMVIGYFKWRTSPDAQGKHIVEHTSITNMLEAALATKEKPA